jgi:hypothetical protein
VRLAIAIALSACSPSFTEIAANDYRDRVHAVDASNQCTPFVRERAELGSGWYEVSGCRAGNWLYSCDTGFKGHRPAACHLVLAASE